jgi:hypothetical protein
MEGWHVAERRLPQPRLVPVKRLVPFGAKRIPKAVQARLLTGAAQRLRRDVEPGDSVVVCSSVRSGSTWLFEMLASDPGVLPVFEPFHPKHNPHMAPFTDELGHLRPPEDPEAAARLVPLVDETLAGRRLTRWSASRAPRGRVRRSRRTLVKEVRISRALPWLVDRWPVPTVVLLRHPCAVVESELRASAAREWLQWPEAQIAAVLRRDLGDDAPAWLADADTGTGTGAGGGAGAARPRLLAALWAVETRAALAAARRAGDRCRVVTYEELVRAPEATVAQLASFAGLHDVAPDPGRLSYMTNPRSPLRQGADPVSAWVDRLDPQLADQVVATVHQLGVGFYGRDPEPDPPALAAALDGIGADPAAGADPADAGSAPGVRDTGDGDGLDPDDAGGDLGWSRAALASGPTGDRPGRDGSGAVPSPGGAP